MNTNASAISDPSRVYDTVRLLEEDDRHRARNRAKINRLSNGETPFTDEEQTEGQIYTNVNFNETAKTLRDARSQLRRSLLEQPILTRITPDDGEPSQKMMLGQIITEEFDRMRKRCAQWTSTTEEVIGQLVLHGLGPVNWTRENSWCPRVIGIEDFLIPSGTYCDLSNLEYFAIRRGFTVSELYECSHKEKAKGAGWNVGLANRLIAKMNEQDLTDQMGGNDWDEYRFPEKVAEDFKQNGFYWQSARNKTIKTYDFYLKREGSWVRRMIVDQSQLPTDVTKEFLFSSRGPVADCHSKIVNIQIADGANVVPFRLHSVRSLGYYQYAIGHLSNRFRCREFDTAFREQMMLFRNTASQEGERKAIIDLYDLGVVPDGLQFVTAAERYQVNHQLIDQTRGSIRQLLSENATVFTQDLGVTGGSTPMTATEALARSNTSSTLMAGVLGKAYAQAERLDREVFRRACMKGDKDSKRFVERCIMRGVPPEMLSPDRYEDFEVVRPRALGSGNQTIEMLKAQALMAVIDRHSPTAQQAILRMYDAAFTDDPDTTALLVPMEESKVVNDSQQKAGVAFLSLMGRKPPLIKPPVILGEYAPTLMLLINMEMQQLIDAPERPTLYFLEGLSMAIKHAAESLQAWVGQSPGAKAVAKQFAEQLAEASKVVQQLTEQEVANQAQEGGEQEQGGDPETKARVEEIMLQAQAKVQAMMETTRSKIQMSETKFQADQERRDRKVSAEIAEKDMKSQADIIRENASLVTRQTPKTKKR